MDLVSERGEDMDNQMILQMMQPFLPPETQEVFNMFNEVAELQKLILAHAERGGENWQLEMLWEIRPKLSESGQYIADVLIKCMELSVLLEKGSMEDGHRSVV